MRLSFWVVNLKGMEGLFSGVLRCWRGGIVRRGAGE